MILVPASRKWKMRSFTLAATLMLACGSRRVVQAQAGLSLHDAIARAQSSPAARISAEQVSAVRGQVRQAGLGPNPRLYLQSEDLRPWAGDFSFANHTEDYGYLGQVLELDGKRSKRVQLATANLHRVQAEQSLRMQEFAGRVAASYWAVAVSSGAAGLLQQDLAAVDDMVRYHKDRVQAGAMRGVDLLRIQIERDRVYVALLASRREADLTRIDLCRQIGVPFSNDLVLTDDLGRTDTLPLLTIETALAQRADLAAARDAVAAAEADVRLQRAGAVPDPDVLAGYKRNSGADTLFASIQLPLGFRSRNQGEIARAESGVRMARAQLEQTELFARADIEAATAGYETQQRIVRDALPDMRDRARKNLEILNDAYRTGGVDLLRYIDAERTAIEIEVSALHALSDYHQAALRLQLAYGVQP